jgi:hypothetical protein
MPNPISGPRKQRTRQHIIADLSVHHLERFILEEGHVAQRVSSDYGYDLMMWTFDEHGYAEPTGAYFQLKASESLGEAEHHYPFDLDVRDYSLWMEERLPVYLVLFDATRRRAYWLNVKQYFHEDDSRHPKVGAKYVRVQVPKRQVINRRAIAAIRKHKRLLVSQEQGVRLWNEPR